MKKYNRPLASQDSLTTTRTLLGNNIYVPFLTREQISKVQTYRLREMIAYAKIHSPWYAKKLNHIDPNHFTLEMLSEIPIMNKRDIMDNWDQIVTDKRLNFDKASAFLVAEQGYELFHGHHLFASGGSSGRRGMFVWDSYEIALTLAGLYQFQYRDEFHNLASYSSDPLMVASIGALRPVHLSETVFSFPLVSNMQSRAFSALAPIDELVRDLNACQPTHLNGYPSVISRLAGKALSGELTIKPRRVLTGAEPLLPDMVEMIKKAWKGIILTNNWGSTDAGIHAVTCDQSSGHLHVLEDMVLIEPVDNENQPVPRGHRSEKIFITNLFRKSMPLFRYEMDDRITTITEKCPCGSEFQLIHSIEGRHEDDFVYGDVVVIAELFENAIMVESGIDEYQVFQTKQGADILIVSEKGSAVNTQRMKTDLIQQLHELGIANPVIEVHLVEQLQRHAETGKLKRFKCLPIEK